MFAELAVGLAGSAAREALGILLDHVGAAASARRLPRAPSQPPQRRSIPAFANAFSARRFVPGDPPPSCSRSTTSHRPKTSLVPPGFGVRSAVEVRAAPVTWLRITPKSGTRCASMKRSVIAEEIAKLHAQGRRIACDIVLATTNGMLDAVSFAPRPGGRSLCRRGQEASSARERSGPRRDARARPRSHRPGRDAGNCFRPWIAVHDETLLGPVERARARPAEPLQAVPLTPELVRPDLRCPRQSIAGLTLSSARRPSGPAPSCGKAIAAAELESLRPPRGEQRIANVRKLLALTQTDTLMRVFRAWLDDAKEQEVAESEAALRILRTRTMRSVCSPSTPAKA